MKRFIIRLAIYAVCIIISDFLVGLIANKLVERAKGGDTMRNNYIANGTTQEVIILGSSRALHHYDPDMLEDAIGMTAYNCGFKANGIIGIYGFYKMIEKRYSPRVIIYDVQPGYDLLSGDNFQFLGQLCCFYDKPCVDSIFWNVGEKERFKMMSKTYRYNSIFHMLIIDNIHSFLDFKKGYRPLDRDMEIEPKNKKLQKDKVYDYDNLKLYYLEKLIRDCEDKTILIFTVSPLFKNTSDDVLEPLRLLCQEYGVSLISHYNDSTFNNRKDYFCDSNHLNLNGATEYSKVIAGEIKQLLEQQHSSTSPSGT